MPNNSNFATRKKAKGAKKAGIPNATSGTGVPNTREATAPVAVARAKNGLDPGAGTWGNLPFDILTVPGRRNWNLSLFKEFVINEARDSRIEFRAESFNTWNHTQFGGPGQNGRISTNLGASNVAAVTAAWDPRVFQLGLKVIY